MKGLIGHTGFVGSNLNSQIKFDKKYNSKNIAEIKNQTFDVLYCAGVSAVKWFANQNPEKDILEIKNLIDNLKEVKTKKIILISTIDIYDKLENVNEDTIPNILSQDTYGKNRYFLENWVKENFEDYLIIRLPALFGIGLKKNFIYDMMNPLPKSIIDKKWEELKEELEKEFFLKLKKSYLKDKNNNFNLIENLDIETKNKIEEGLKAYGFTSLCFTDSRSYFPFYYLDNLKKDIEIALERGIKILNLSVEPITCSEIAEKVFNLKIHNCIHGKEPVKYDMKSKYSTLYQGDNGYLYNKKETIEFLKEFVEKVVKNEVGNI